jgi:hypothetical protein
MSFSSKKKNIASDYVSADNQPDQSQRDFLFSFLVRFTRWSIVRKRNFLKGCLLFNLKEAKRLEISDSEINLSVRPIGNAKESRVNSRNSPRKFFPKELTFDASYA